MGGRTRARQRDPAADHDLPVTAARPPRGALSAASHRGLLLRVRTRRAPQRVALGRLGAMLRIRDCLDAGKFVGMLADRTIAAAPAQLVSFLGRAALFPSGPMRAAAALRRPVIFMTGLYRGGNHYHVVFRQIADFSRPAPGGREAAVRAGIVRYVAVLEEYCHSDPYNWFNFYDFWHGADATAGASAGASASEPGAGA